MASEFEEKNVGAKISGGDKAEKYLADLQQRATSKTIKVGFLEDASYPNGMSVAAVAMLNEYGGTINVPARQQTVNRLTGPKGLLRGGKFVKASKANLTTTHDVKSHTITIPPRPFFRNMVNEKQDTWADDVATLLTKHNYDVELVANLMGERIKGQLQQSIIDLDSPPNAASTIARKGSSNPLIDSGLMVSRVSYNIE